MAAEMRGPSTRLLPIQVGARSRPPPILMEKTELIQRAKPAEQVKSYKPTVTCMNFVTEQGAELSHLLSVACKNAVGDHRSSWRVT